MTARDRLTAIKARLDAATPGEWRAELPDHRKPEWGGYGVETVDDSPVTGQAIFYGNGGCASKTNADLIANAPADLRWCLKRLERAEALLRRVTTTNCSRSEFFDALGAAETFLEGQSDEQ